MKQYIGAILNGFSEIFFLPHYKSGILIFAIILISPNVALAGFVSVVAAYLFARLVNMDRDFLKLGFYTYNPLLVGLSVGYLFKITPLTILFVIISGILAFVATIAVYNIFSTYLKLPVLSLPFVIVSTIAYLASAKYADSFIDSPHAVDTLGAQLPFWLSGYFKALGAIFFMPQVIPGLVLAVSILAASRILFLLSVVGYYAGASFTALMVGSFTQAFTDMSHFNGILVAMALGGIFLIPSLKSYVLALIAVFASAILRDSVLALWSYVEIPEFTLPFNIISLSFVYALGLINYPHLTRLVKSTPEETLDYYLSNRRRYRGYDKTLLLPFAGEWTVWQGFNGQWTHQGKWKYGYDFFITDEQDDSYRCAGDKLSDYYAYRKPVLSPVAGRVVKAIDSLPDNPIGQVDKANSWGNLVIIQDDRGFFVEISHFAQDSLQVDEGARVERGALLGLCGNSGYSPQPHIHIQVQLAEAIGARTVPFSFVSYNNDNHFHSNELPAEGTRVEPLYWGKNSDAKTSFILDDVYQYDVVKDGKKIDDLTLTVKMLPDGTFYFDSGRGKLYFGKHEGVFYFYSMEGNDPYLGTMLLALPRLPLTCRQNLQWSDQLPIGLVTKGFTKAMAQFISSFHHDFAEIRAELTRIHENKVVGTIQSLTLGLEKKTFVEWDDRVGFKTIRVDNIELRRARHEYDLRGIGPINGRSRNARCGLPNSQHSTGFGTSYGRSGSIRDVLIMDL